MSHVLLLRVPIYKNSNINLNPFIESLDSSWHLLSTGEGILPFFLRTWKVNYPNKTFTFPYYINYCLSCNQSRYKKSKDWYITSNPEVLIHVQKTVLFVRRQNILIKMKGNISFRVTRRRGLSEVSMSLNDIRDGIGESRT